MTSPGRAFSDISEAEYLSTYDIRSYPCYAVTADVALFSMLTRESDNYRKERTKALSVLLIHRRAHPERGKLALPGGFLHPDETVEACALRELREETGLTPGSLSPLGVYSAADRDPRGRVISNAFLSVVPERPFELHADGDADDAQWYEITLEPEGADTRALTLTGGAETVRALLRTVTGPDGSTHMEVVENGLLAFDHAAILGDAITLLRRRARSYELALRFLPELFTLSDFQQTYEKLTGETVLTANFRRKTADLVRETERFTSGTGHRPARLYTRA